MPRTRRRRACWWLVAAVVEGVAVAGACSNAPTAAKAPLPVAATHGRFVWHDLVTRDAEAARKFYGELLGWNFKQTRREGKLYFLAVANGNFVGGIIQAEGTGPSGPAAWLSYLSVPDLERAVTADTAAGGKVLLEPRQAGVYGRIAVVSDPQGAPLGLASLTQAIPGGDPTQPATNEFFWMEYLASNGAMALEFYKALGGYESAMTDSALGFDYYVLKNGRPRAGLFQIPSSATMVKPNWLPYVKVPDPAALIAQVLVLGGSVLIAPRPEVRNGTLAVIADPTGGVIALQRWPM